jgi:general stress protein 26
MAIDPLSLEHCLKLMDESSAVCLATVNGSVPKQRALWNLRRQDRFPSAAVFCREQGLIAYSATSLGSGKIHDIRANPAVSLYYCDAVRVCGVMLTGRAEILTDAGLKRALWHESWSIYWPGGAADADYCVIRVTPSAATGWWGTSPFHFEAMTE